MKKKKAIVFLLLLLMVVTSFYGCHPVNVFSEFESLVTEESSEQTDKRPVALSQPAYLGPPFYVQGASSAEAYGYGEEIEITVAFKFNMLSGDVDFAFMDNSKNSVDCSLILEESPSYEIVGENTVTFENVDRYYYDCSIRNKYSFENPLVATFKIKIYEAEYDIYEMNFSVFAVNNSFDEEMWKDYPFQDEIDADKEFRYTIDVPMYYITDTQGIIINPLYVSHSYGYGNPSQKLIQKSFEREKLNGIDDEILINRYLDMLFDESDVFYCVHSIHKKIPWYLRERFTKREEICHYYSYISKDLRFRVYIPFTDTEEFYETRKSLTETDSKASLYERDCQRLRALLNYALENGVISEDEYNTEINRLETEEIFCRHCMYIGNVEAIPSPDDDSYYNYVLDPRVDWDKAYPTFWEWLSKLLEELLSNIF